MSRAFRVFLLIVLLFGALWAYRYRARDLRAWLEFGEPPPPEADELVGLRSPVDRVLTPRMGARLPAFFVRRVESPAAVPEDPPEVFVDPPTAPELQERVVEPAAEYGRELARGPDEPEREPVVLRFFPRPRSPRREAADEAIAPKPIGGSLDPQPAPQPGPKSAPKSAPAAERGARRPSGTPSGTIAPGSGSQNLSPGATQPGAKKKRSDQGGPTAVLANATPVETAPAQKTVSHVVRDRETLASLARRYYKNDTERWREIFSANQHRIADPDRLPLGLVLEIPGVQPARPQSRPAIRTRDAKIDPVRSAAAQAAAGGAAAGRSNRSADGQMRGQGVDG